MKNIVNHTDDYNDDLDQTHLLHAKEMLYNDIVKAPIQATNNEINKTIPKESHCINDTDLEKVITERRRKERAKIARKDMKVAIEKQNLLLDNLQLTGKYQNGRKVKKRELDV